MTEIVYKLFRKLEWREALRDGLFAGSPDDRRDGFIHLSSAGQVRGTFERYFATEPAPVLVGFDIASLGPRLKWEPSRGGELFPHFYGTLDPARAVSVHEISRGEMGNASLPEGF